MSWMDQGRKIGDGNNTATAANIRQKKQKSKKRNALTGLLKDIRF